MSAFQIIYTVIGGLGIFFYGMKMMSDALQAAAGEMIQRIINSLTTNRLLAIAVGAGVTMIIQSSSVTTVMVVGLVNAGLMKLTQAIGVIIGANIGTTVTGWIISIKIGKYGLLLVSLGIFPTLFSKSEKWKELGKVIFGVGLIFMGLELMSHALKPLRHDQAFLDSISYFAGEHYGAYLASALVGCLLTMLIQSSSAMLGVTIAMAMNGVINYHSALAIVVGSNIGTTITALLASVGGNVNAKRASRAHAIFNITGTVITMMIFPFFANFVDAVIPGDPNLVGVTGDRPNVAIHLATGHTVFNVAFTLLFIPLVKVLADFVTKITPDGSVKESKKLIILGNPSDMLPATGLLQAENEIKKFSDVVGRMFNLTYEYIMDEESDARVMAKVKNYERIADNIEREVTVFLSEVMKKQLTSAQSVQAQVILRSADELESIADYLERLAHYITRFKSEATWDKEAKEDFEKLLRKVKEFYFIVVHLIDDKMTVDMNDFLTKKERIKILADDIRNRHLNRMSEQRYNPIASSLTYSDMIVSLRKVTAHSSNVSQVQVRSEA